jgi:hypothetical protein
VALEVHAYFPEEQAAQLVTPPLEYKYVPVWQVLHTEAMPDQTNAPIGQDNMLIVTDPLEYIYPLEKPEGSGPNTAASQLE